MGSGGSTRSTHFHNDLEEDDVPENEDPPPMHYVINISNKMVERLVEDQTVEEGGTQSLQKKDNQRDAKDKILAEKLQNLDNKHSEKIGLTCKEIRSTLKRIELRANVSDFEAEPVCADCEQALMKCYDTCDGKPAKCGEILDNFSKCVHETVVTRLHKHTMKEVREAERRTRNVKLYQNLSIPLPEPIT